MSVLKFWCATFEKGLYVGAIGLLSEMDLFIESLEFGLLGRFESVISNMIGTNLMGLGDNNKDT